MIFEATNLTVDYRLRGGAPGRRLRAVDDVSFSIGRGETLGLVGESGSGKSTTALAVLKLVRATQGSLRLNGQEITTATGAALRRLRRDMQMVFQDPYSSLDPSMTVFDSLVEPLAVHRLGERRARYDEAAASLAAVGLEPASGRRYPHEFSGGQRQRIAIARALITKPSFVVCDEPVSALDVSTQGQIVNLLRDLQAERGLALLFIAHDLAVVRHVSDRIAVMYLSQIVETGPSERIWSGPAHPYTAALLSAIPTAGQGRRERIVLQGDLPSAVRPPSGCRFHTRCPFVMDTCRREAPRPHPVEGGGTAACHLHTSGPTLDGRSVTELVGQLH